MGWTETELVRINETNFVAESFWENKCFLLFSHFKNSKLVREAFKNKNNETYGIFHMLVDNLARAGSSEPLNDHELMDIYMDGQH